MEVKALDDELQGHVELVCAGSWGSQGRVLVIVGILSIITLACRTFSMGWFIRHTVTPTFILGWFLRITGEVGHQFEQKNST